MVTRLFNKRPWAISGEWTHIFTKGMLREGLKVKKLNNFSNFKSVVSKLCRISL